MTLILTLIRNKESTATDGTAQPKMTAQPQVRIIGICSKNIISDFPTKVKKLSTVERDGTGTEKSA